MGRNPFFLRANLDEKKKKAPGWDPHQHVGPIQSTFEGSATREAPEVVFCPLHPISLPTTHLPRRTGSGSNQVLGLFPASLLLSCFRFCSIFSRLVCKASSVLFSRPPPFCLANLLVLPDTISILRQTAIISACHHCSSSFHRLACTADSAVSSHFCL